MVVVHCTKGAHIFGRVWTSAISRLQLCSLLDHPYLARFPEYTFHLLVGRCQVGGHPALFQNISISRCPAQPPFNDWSHPAIYLFFSSIFITSTSIIFPPSLTLIGQSFFSDVLFVFLFHFLLYGSGMLTNQYKKITSMSITLKIFPAHQWILFHFSSLPCSSSVQLLGPYQQLPTWITHRATALASASYALPSECPPSTLSVWLKF